MTKHTPRDQVREQRKVAELAREYSARGFTVWASHPGWEPPAPIDGFVPDLVAKRGAETIIIEVKSRSTLSRDAESLASIARSAQKDPNTRFDLVVTNPRPLASKDRRAEVIREELNALRTGLLEELKEAVRANNAEIAVVLGYHLLSALLLRVAVAEQVESKSASQSARALAERLRDKGIISASVVSFTSELELARNQVAHRSGSLLLLKASDVQRKLSSLVDQWIGSEPRPTS
jgi:Holliday junction resolvase